MVSTTKPTDALLEATTALVPSLLNALDGLAHAGRHLHPPDLPEVVASAASLVEPVTIGLEIFNKANWPENLHAFRNSILDSSQNVLHAFSGLQQAAAQPNGMMASYTSLGYLARAQEALFPVTQMLPVVSRYFVEPELRQNDSLIESLTSAPEETGIFHVNNERQARGGFSVYVPENYSPDITWPLIVALHGGSGHGRNFLFSWLTNARTHGAILLAPTSQGRTWSIMDTDIDSTALTKILAIVNERYRIDETRVLVTGMSDGGTYAWLSGLVENSPFTHLAPVSSSFHPMLLQGTTPERLNRLPIYLVHGVLDWMFAIDMAREAASALTAAGANVIFREIEDLSHTYPREENAKIMQWFLASPS